MYFNLLIIADVMFQVENGAIWGVVMMHVISVLSLSIKWTGPMLFKQRLTPDQRISQKGV